MNGTINKKANKKEKGNDNILSFVNHVSTVPQIANRHFLVYVIDSKRDIYNTNIQTKIAPTLLNIKPKLYRIKNTTTIRLQHANVRTSTKLISLFDVGSLFISIPSPL